jgi:hypothetical protein|tara:strand:+ start:274 stop:378 length:105 start_codon:yes stop_codon:yes gene_type:complete
MVVHISGGEIYFSSEHKVNGIFEPEAPGLDDPFG